MEVSVQSDTFIIPCSGHNQISCVFCSEPPSIYVRSALFFVRDSYVILSYDCNRVSSG
jgi:hypothetical protein